MNAMINEALVKIDCYLETGIQGFAVQAADRIRADGRAVLHGSKWTRDYAVRTKIILRTHG